MASSPPPPSPSDAATHETSKIKTLTTKITTLESSLATLEARQQQLLSELKFSFPPPQPPPLPLPLPNYGNQRKDRGPASETVKSHIRLLHRYNEMRDTAMGLLGLVAENRGVRVREVVGEFGVRVEEG